MAKIEAGESAATQKNHLKTGACARNVGRAERLASAVLGGGLLYYGLKRRGLLPALIGGGLVLRGASGHCELYHRAGINTAGSQSQRQTSVPHGEGVKVSCAVIIDRPAQELYRFWRDLNNLPRFMSRLETLEIVGEDRSRWTFRAFAGQKLSWDAAIINDVPNEIIAWRSLDGADLDHAGTVRFEPASGGRGTVVRVVMEYRPPAGKFGVGVAKLMGAEPKQVIEADLRRFKQLMESGELASVENQPTGAALMSS